MRDSHCHLPEKLSNLKGTAIENGITIFDISDIQNRGPAYCIVKTHRFAPASLESAADVNAPERILDLPCFDTASRTR